MPGYNVCSLLSGELPVYNYFKALSTRLFYNVVERPSYKVGVEGSSKSHFLEFNLLVSKRVVGNEQFSLCVCLSVSVSLSLSPVWIDVFPECRLELQTVVIASGHVGAGV